MDESNPYEAPAADIDEPDPMEMDPYGGGQLASRGSRLGAKLVTGLTGIVPVLVYVPFGEAGSEPLRMLGGVLAGILLLGLLGLNVYWLYDNGQTIGKRALDIKIVRGDRQSRASLVRILFVRQLSESVFSSCCSALWLADVMFIFSEERQCLHDMIADTNVIVDGTADEGGILEEDFPESNDPEPSDEAFDDAVHEW